MRILLMADVPAGLDSGAAGTEFQTVAALRRLGHEVDTVWADSLPHRIKHGGLHYLLELPWAYRGTMLARMRGKDYEIIHVDQPHGYLAARVLASRGNRPVFIHRSHGFEPLVARELARWKQVYPVQDSRSWCRVQASRGMDVLLARHSDAIAEYADGHIVSASDCARFMTEAYRVPPARIAVIPQAAPRQYLESTAPVMTPARSKRLLYVGQFAYVKAPMILAAVINRVVEMDREVTVTWVTSKSAHGSIRQLLSERGRSRVALLDWMPQRELIDVYDGHGTFIFPSFFEGFGKVFLEAMARGLCVVASDVGGAKDVICNGLDGILVPAGSIDAATQGCLGLFGSINKAREMSQRAALRARQFTWDRVAKETVAFYERRLNAMARKDLR